MAAVTSWGAGEYPLMAERLISASENTVRRAAICEGERVLDIATGSGNAALLAAREGAEVLGVDFEPALLAVAQQRAEREALQIEWRCADATETLAPDNWADCVLSVFGVMFVPDHHRAAVEMARIVRPGGRLLVASWRPGSFIPAMGMALMEFLPAPPVGAAPPSAWGDRAQLTTILSGADLELDSVDDDTVTLTFRDVDDATEFLLRTAGNLAAIKPQLQHEGRWEQLVARLRAHVENSGVWRDDGLEIVAPYLVAKATKPES